VNSKEPVSVLQLPTRVEPDSSISVQDWPKLLNDSAGRAAKRAVSTTIEKSIMLVKGLRVGSNWCVFCNQNNWKDSDAYFYIILIS